MTTSSNVEYINADILTVHADVIVHQVNCMGIMNSGVAKAISTKYPEILPLYKSRARAIRRGVCRMGDVQIIQCNDGTYICNLFSQFDYGYDGEIYTQYDALHDTLTVVSKHFHNQRIAIPFRIGCGRGGGNWDIVRIMIEKIFEGTDNHVIICRYDPK